MNVKYLADTDEFVVDSSGRRYRLSYFEHKYVLEEIVPPCSDLEYVKDFESLGEALEALMHAEMEET